MKERKGLQLHVYVIFGDATVVNMNKYKCRMYCRQTVSIQHTAGY